MDVKRYTFLEYLMYSSLLLVIFLVGVPLILFLGAWGLKALVWYVELWMTLPWPL